VLEAALGAKLSLSPALRLIPPKTRQQKGRALCIAPRSIRSLSHSKTEYENFETTITMPSFRPSTSPSSRPWPTLSARLQPQAWQPMSPRWSITAFAFSLRSKNFAKASTVPYQSTTIPLSLLRAFEAPVLHLQSTWEDTLVKALRGRRS